MSTTAVEKECLSKMSKAVDFLKQEFRGVRTGRAHPGLVEHLKIEVSSYGSTMELRELATISVPEPTMLLVKPFDPGTLKDIERGLQTSDLGVAPMNDGRSIRLPIPTLSGERRQQLVGLNMAVFCPPDHRTDMTHDYCAQTHNAWFNSCVQGPPSGVIVSGSTDSLLDGKHLGMRRSIISLADLIMGLGDDSSPLIDNHTADGVLAFRLGLDCLSKGLS